MRFFVPKPISIRRLLIVLAVAPTLVLATIFVLLTYRSNQVAIRNLTDGLTTEISARIDTHLKQFLDSTLSVTAIHADLIAAGQLDHHDQQQMETYFFRNMYHYPLVNSMYFGNESGGLVGSGRDGNVPYVTGTAGYTAGTFYKYAVDSEGVRTSLLSEFPDFDARNRMWFQEAERQRTAVWSEPYVFFTGQDMAIAARMINWDLMAREVLIKASSTNNNMAAVPTIRMSLAELPSPRNELIASMPRKFSAKPTR